MWSARILKIIMPFKLIQCYNESPTCLVEFSDQVTNKCGDWYKILWKACTVSFVHWSSTFFLLCNKYILVDLTRKCSQCWNGLGNSMLIRIRISYIPMYLGKAKKVVQGCFVHSLYTDLVKRSARLSYCGCNQVKQ